VRWRPRRVGPRPGQPSLQELDLRLFLDCDILEVIGPALTQEIKRLEATTGNVPYKLLAARMEVARIRRWCAVRDLAGGQGGGPGACRGGARA
jgi:hypothetical protein